MLKYLKSATFWGGVIAGVANALPVLSSGVFGPKAQAYGTMAGAILAGFGIKRATSRTDLEVSRLAGDMAEAHRQLGVRVAPRPDK